ncbi:putative peptide-N(4)-(N-acetyl-beta-glucosaminyl)asparagine amidase [Operophtera brumata]|uniref:Peptide-N(4)-(N-acetyl-beta-glucosaminyl)asparagine amidase n=1 Tax=Operophtera brumata TaxID=104452 RepID=A0A0L7L9N5_OPEBR|nr:putative peptide-N(4)-(N-acetyl-beta-glucosaminyl)asparagine amidase [Operophtera brumata]
MEDMARLALVEQSVRDNDKFRNVLYELLRHINHILENPHDYQIRTIESSILKDFLKIDTLIEYLKYVGFESVAIERKISICCGTIDKNQILRGPNLRQPVVKNKILPAHVLIQDLFNNMIQYEDPQLLAHARDQIPIVTLQVMALDRVREQQKKIKTGEIKSQDLPFDIALLMELMAWFKYKFFTWVDSPACECGGATTPSGGATQLSRGEMCRVELYKCSSCRAWVSFPRYNNPRTLLEWRRGRCGEWANCFTLLCRALGYDVRYVYDVTDHVWCEVFDYDTNTWLHCDPCEAKLNAPLMYSHGWGKKLSYVIAVSRDDLQDVTWRYTTEHKEVLKRRRECSEADLVECIVRLRHHRQRQGSEARRLKPDELESHGRISGSAVWRMERGECGAGRAPHTFLFSEPGTHNISRDSVEAAPLSSWAAGVHEARGVFRKIISALYEDGNITWSLTFDAEQPVVVALGVRALLSGGSGSAAWQHAQLFRQPLDADTPAFVVQVHVHAYRYRNHAWYWLDHGTGYHPRLNLGHNYYFYLALQRASFI